MKDRNMRKENIGDKIATFSDLDIGREMIQREVSLLPTGPQKPENIPFIATALRAPN
jgi:hypothetical protein